MSEQSSVNSLELIYDQACEWVVRLRSGNVSMTDTNQFGEWLCTSDNHRSCFEKVADMFEDTAVLAYLPTDQLAPTTRQKTQRKRHFGWKTLTGALAASVIAAFVWLMPATPETQVFQTAVGEQQTIQLPDGSQVDINTDSVLEVVFDEDSRQLTLKRGEAYFDVAKDTSRPFIVHFGNASARALGTEFNIFRQQDKTTVTVTEGVVSVNKSRHQSSATILQAQDAAAYDATTGDISQFRDDKPNVTLAWRASNVIFDKTPLQEVINTLNRYSSTPIQLQDKELATELVSGTFSIKHPLETAQAVAQALSLSADLTADNLLLHEGANRI